MKAKLFLPIALMLITACKTAIEVTTTKAPTTTVGAENLGTIQRSPFPTSTQGDGVPPACAYGWGSKPLPILTRQWQEAIANMQVNSLNTYVQAYGENCINDQGNVLSFSEMRTEFYTTMLVDNKTDAEAMSSLIKQVFVALETIPPQKRVSQECIAYITFKATDWERSIWFTNRSMKDALERELTAEEFLASLEHW